MRQPAVVTPASAAARWVKLRSGLYYFTHPNQQSTTALASVGVLRVTPFVVPNTVTLSKIGIEVTTIGDVGSKVRLGIYADDGAGYPGALVLDAGTIAGDSATAQEITISQVLGHGVYWVGAVGQVITTTAPTVRAVNTNTPSGTGFSSIPSGTPTSVGYAQTSVTGALPSSFSATLSSSGTAFRTFVKVA